jgi:hypothetical protein
MEFHSDMVKDPNLASCIAANMLSSAQHADLHLEGLLSNKRAAEPDDQQLKSKEAFLKTLQNKLDKFRAEDIAIQSQIEDLQNQQSEIQSTITATSDRIDDAHVELKVIMGRISGANPSPGPAAAKGVSFDDILPMLTSLHHTGTIPSSTQTDHLTKLLQDLLDHRNSISEAPAPVTPTNGAPSGEPFAASASSASTSAPVLSAQAAKKAAAKEKADQAALLRAAEAGGYSADKGTASGTDRVSPYATTPA